MYGWLPTIQHHFPGCGITHLNVWDTPYRWWHIYVRDALSIVEAQKKDQQDSERSRRGK